VKAGEGTHGKLAAADPVQRRLRRGTVIVRRGFPQSHRREPAAQDHVEHRLARIQPLLDGGAHPADGPPQHPEITSPQALPEDLDPPAPAVGPHLAVDQLEQRRLARAVRSEERRVGKECRWWCVADAATYKALLTRVRE